MQATAVQKSEKMENKGQSESSDPIKQVLLLIEKKVRNLEKRKSRIDAIREKARDRDTKTALNEEQKEALEKYELVLQNIEFLKELQKSVVTLVADHEKQLKKQQKKERLERSIAEQKRFRELLEIQTFLDSLGDEKIRNDFLHGTNGATVLSEENLGHLDQLYQLISPNREESENYEQQLNEAAEHISNLLDGRDRPVGQTTYQHLHQLIVQMRESKYFIITHNGASHEEESHQVATSSDASAANNDQQPAAERLSSDIPSSHVSDTVSHDPQAATSYASGDGTTKSLVTSSFEGVAPGSYEPFYPSSSSSLYQSATVTAPQRGNIQEIVSQSPFNFFQDSEIETNDYGSNSTFESSLYSGIPYNSQTLTSVSATYGQAYAPSGHATGSSHHFASTAASESYQLATSLASASLGPAAATPRHVDEGKKNFKQAAEAANTFQTFPSDAGALNFSTQSQTFVNSSLAIPPENPNDFQDEYLEGTYGGKKTNPLPPRDQSFGRARDPNSRGGNSYGSDRRGRGGYPRDNDYDNRNSNYYRRDNGQHRGGQRGGGPRDNMRRPFRQPQSSMS